MINGIGLDLCGIDRMEALVKDGRFLEKYYTPSERAYIAGRGQMAAASAAGMFAAKEAFLKAAGTGLAGAALNEIEVKYTPCLEDILEADKAARAVVRRCVSAK